MGKLLDRVVFALRPAPHRSGFLAIFYTLLILVLLKFIAYYEPTPSESLALLVKTILAAGFIGASVFAASALLNRLRPWPMANPWVFGLEIALIAGVVTLERAILASTEFPSRHVLELSQPYFQTFLLNFGTLSIVHVALNLQQRELSIKLAEAEAQTKSLRMRQQDLVFSDEEIKQQVSQFLHNRIQSDLMVSGLQLKEVAGGLPIAQASRILDVVAKLEKVRSMDIRSLSQSLGPNLVSQQLRGALEALASSYLPQMKVELHLASDLGAGFQSSPEQLQLGIYRITEQALLNSLVHGPANNVLIRLETKGMQVKVSITDDGPGSSGNPVSGLGTSVIDAWVDILHGQKRVVTAPSEGYSIEVTLPL
jgi:signal transduction histidine kinase